MQAALLEAELKSLQELDSSSPLSPAVEFVSSFLVIHKVFITRFFPFCFGLLFMHAAAWLRTIQCIFQRLEDVMPNQICTKIHGCNALAHGPQHKIENELEKRRVKHLEAAV